MFRPQVLFVRLIILGLIALSLWLSAPGWLPPLVRHSLHRSFGDVIDFERCMLDWSRNGIELQNVQIADPENPLRNLVQSNSVWLQFDRSSLWTPQWKIEKVRWNEVVLGSPRENLAGDRLNGAIYGFQAPASSRVNYDLNAAAKRWLDQVQALPPVEHGASAAEFAANSKAIRTQWETDFEQQRRQAEQVREEISSIQAELKRAGRNPLRLAEEERERLLRLGQLESRLEESRQWLSNWPTVQAQAIARLASNRETAPSGQLSSSKFASTTLASSQSLLVSEVDLQTAQQIVEWALILHRRLEGLSSTTVLPPQRGRTVPLRGVSPAAGLVATEVEFSGALHTAAGHIDFAGFCQPLSDRPDLTGEPLKFQLKGQGKSPFQIEGTLDLEAGEIVQSIRIQLLPKDVPAAELGTASSVLVKTSAHRMQADAFIQIRGEQLEGEINCFHSKLGLFVNSLSDIAGGQNVQEKLNRHLSMVQNIEVLAEISGTVSKPEITFRSNLGESFTPALAECLNESHFQRQTYDQTLIEQTYETVVKSLTDFASEQVTGLQQLLQDEQVRLGELDRNLPSNGLRPFR